MPLCLAFQKSALQKAIALAATEAVRFAGACPSVHPPAGPVAQAEQVDLAEGPQPFQLAVSSDRCPVIL